MISKKLKIFRESVFKYTLKDVEQKTGIGQSSLSDFENDKREPSIHQLSVLAKLYNVPVSRFFQDTDELVCDLVLWREEPSDTTLKAELETKFKKLCKQYRNLEIWTKSPLEKDFVSFFLKSFPNDEENVRFQARNIRHKLGLGKYPGKSLFRILEEKYFVKIFNLDLRSSSAVCCHSNEVGSAIALNVTNSMYRRNFDLAHELFHLLTWSFVNKQQKDVMEEYADVFASELLMPKDSIMESVDDFLRKDSKKLSFNDIVSISRRFVVSIEALMWRIRKVYNVDFEHTKEIIGKIKKYACEIKVKQNTEQNMGGLNKFPERYVNLAFEALKIGEISTKQCANYLERNISDLLEMNLWSGGDSKIDISFV
ncbi:helix-turn-helix domain-containing protein [Candidatus Endomicrobiellum agilis]|uniref:helix-turn-helix domain-containing protein n=1 Tax=Candidatus Endomicrobiellum agilis TaxID=3238957 RepID=UPI003579D512|nr:XRE family transcriptional regulator [Endomicrobium sp.]